MKHRQLELSVGPANGGSPPRRSGSAISQVQESRFLGLVRDEVREGYGSPAGGAQVASPRASRLIRLTGAGAGRGDMKPLLVVFDPFKFKGSIIRGFVA